MPTHPRVGPTVLDALRRRQALQRSLLERLERATVRLERLQRAVRAQEARIAPLERRAAAGRRRGNASAAACLEAPMIFNAISGTASEDPAAHLARIVRALADHGIAAQPLVGTPEEALARAERAAREREPLFLVAGGDGTLSQVASRLIGSDTVLGILPVGTMNNVARSLGVPLQLEAACALIGMGTVRRVDVGRLSRAGAPEVEHFLEAAGVGMSAIAIYAGEAVEKRRWHFLPRALRRFKEATPGAVTVELDGVAVEAHSHLVTVSNAPLFGNNMLLSPGARMDDGLLDVRLYDGMTVAALAAHFVLAARGETHALPVRRARRVRITTEHSVPSHSDTDLVPDRRAVDIEVLPRTLLAIAGNGVALTLPVEAGFAPPPLSGPPAATDRGRAHA